MNKRILTEIWIYPIKSLGGVRLKSAKVMEKGLRYDRRWMLIDETNMFMTQRLNNKMALFKVSMEEDGFRITHLEESIFLPFDHSFTGEPLTATIWDDIVSTKEVSKDFSQWFSDRLGFSCKLVAFPEENPRPVDAQYKINDDHVSLADGYPLLIIGESSLADLNGRLKEPVLMNRFRPNLVFKGGDAFEEDDWKNFTVGKNQFVGVKPCARCVLITVNQETSEKGKEPLTTLSTYRNRNGKVYFGQNVIALDYKEIYEGDEIVF